MYFEISTINEEVAVRITWLKNPVSHQIQMFMIAPAFIKVQNCEIDK